MTMSRAMVARLLVAALLVARTAGSFTAPRIPEAASSTGSTARFQPHTRLTVAPVISVPEEESGKIQNILFPKAPRRRNLFSLTDHFARVKNLFRFLQQQQRGVQHKRKALALALAAFVWLQAGQPRHVHAAATTNKPALVEQVQRGGDRGESGKSKIKKRRASQKVSSTAMHGKLAVAAVAGTMVVAPSAGFVMSRREKETNDHDKGGRNGFSAVAAQAGVKTRNTASSTKPTKTSRKESTANFNALREQEKKQVVDKVLKKANAARQKVDSDVYLKSLQKEKSVIHSALETLKKGPPAAPVAAATQQVKAIVSEPVKKIVVPVIKNPAAMLTRETASATAELPLMTKHFVQARSQPKGLSEEKRLQQKYAAIPDVGERAYQILVDLGMVEIEQQSSATGTKASSDSFSALLPAEDEQPFQ